MKKQFILILGVLGLGSLVVFGISTSEKQDLVFDGNGNSIFFDFNDDVENSEIAICGETCNGIEKNTSFVQGVTGSAVKFEAQNESWLTVPHHSSLSFGEEGGATIVFSVKVDTHSYKHNMIYNKGDVGWGTSTTHHMMGCMKGNFLNSKQFGLEMSQESMLTYTVTMGKKLN